MNAHVVFTLVSVNYCSAWDTEPYSHAEVECVARLAGFLARDLSDKKVWSLDKANVLVTSRLWRKVMTETFKKEFLILRSSAS